MPNHGHPGAGAKGDINATMKTIMDQAITDDMFKNLNQHVIIWEDESPASTPAEAKDFNDKGQQARPDDSKTSESGDAVPQFQQVALASPDTSGQIVYSATADVVEAHAAPDSEVQVAQADTDHSGLHDAGSDSHALDGGSGADMAAAHPVDAGASVGEDATA